VSGRLARFKFARARGTRKSGRALARIFSVLHESNKELPDLLEEIPISLPDLCKSGREIGISFADLCISPGEIGILLKEIGISPEDSACAKGDAERFFGGALDKRRPILRKLRLFRELLPRCATRLRLRFESSARPFKAQRSSKARL